MAWERVLHVLSHPELVRERIFELRQTHKEMIQKDDITSMLASIKKSMQNLYELTCAAEDEETVAEIKLKLQTLEARKKDALVLLRMYEDDERDRAELEEEIGKFEKDAVKYLTNDISYEQKRRALHLLGFRVIVNPIKDDYPHRF